VRASWHELTNQARLTKHATRTAVSAKGLRKAYKEKVVLDGVDLSIGEGEVFALLGPNGAGKTTTVQILSTLIPADAGTASIMGHDLRGEAGAVRAVIGVTGQFSAVDNLLTGEETCSSWAACCMCRRPSGGREPPSY
jgi:ABC-2 type transport system ATP-binding protein